MRKKSHTFINMGILPMCIVLACHSGEDTQRLNRCWVHNVQHQKHGSDETNVYIPLCTKSRERDIYSTRKATVRFDQRPSQ